MQNHQNPNQKIAEPETRKKSTIRSKSLHSSWTAINVFGWVFIAVSLYCLFGMLFVVYEGLAFQRHIAFLTSEDKARGVLDVVHRQYVDRQRYGDEDVFPVGAIAVKLDRLKRAVDDLEKFNITNATLKTAKDGKEQQLQEAISSLAAGFTDIERLLEKKVGDDLKFVSRLSDIQETIRGLDCIKEAGAEERAADKVLDGCSARRSWEVSIPENGTGDRPANGIVKTTDDHEKNGYLAAAMIENGLKGIHHDLASLRGEHSHLANALSDFLNDIGDRIADLQNAYDPNAITITLAGLKPKENEVDRIADIETSIAALRTSVAELDGIATEFFPGIALARQFSEPMGKFEIALSAFDNMSLHEVTFDDGDNSADGTEAVSIFNQQQKSISQAALQLENDLADNTPVIRIAQVIGDDDPAANAKAKEIWTALVNFERFEPLVHPSLPTTDFRIGVNPHLVATLSPQALTFLLVFIIGAIGSLIYITKYQLDFVIKGNKIYQQPPRSLAWYFFRPVFGVVIAFAVYLLYKAGQLALGSGGPGALDTAVNLPILSVIALFAGLLSWHALEVIESRGKTWFAERSRQDLWATGLGNALELEKRSMQECAYQVGRSIEQIERWMMFQDRITPEMQDRIRTWLDRPLQELFGERKPTAADKTKPLWGPGLKAALHGGMDAKGLAELLGEESVERVRKWLNQELKVSPAMQWRLVHVLNQKHELLFPPHEQNREAWAIALRARLRQSRMDPKGLAHGLGVTVEQVYRWMELEESASFEWQLKILDALKIDNSDHPEIFDFAEPDDARLAVNLKRDLKAADNLTPEELADYLMISVSYVRQWMDRKKKVAQTTQTWIADYLKKDRDDIFPPVP